MLELRVVQGHLLLQVQRGAPQLERATSQWHVFFVVAIVAHRALRTVHDAELVQLRQVECGHGLVGRALIRCDVGGLDLSVQAPEPHCRVVNSQYVSSGGSHGYHLQGVPRLSQGLPQPQTRL